MTDSKKILIPIDFSDISLNTLEYAAAIGHQIRGELHVLHVMETYQFNAKVGKVLDYTDALKRQVEEQLDDFRTEHANLWGIKTVAHLKNGKIYRSIIDATKELSPEFVVMSTYGASGVDNLQKYFLGSNAYRVVNNAGCPVLTIRKERSNPTFKKLLLPIDVTAATDQKVARAVDWAKTFDATIHVISISETLDALTGKGNKPAERLDEIAESINEAGVRCEASHFKEQQIADTVMNYAEVHEMDLIFIMTRKERGATTKIIGSTARKIIENSTVPVLSLQPQG